MSMSKVDAIEAMAQAEDAIVTHVSASAIGAIARSEVEAQLDAAHKYKRSVTKFLHEAQTMATLNQEIAESCMYSLPRGGKMITGPSVRLAEICASAYCNLQIAARVMDAEEKEIVAQGAAWDMERNIRFTIEVRRRIVNKRGQRFDDDMIVVTGNAAASIALRNAIFRVIPRAYVDLVYEKARSVAVGDSKTLGARRDQILDRLSKMGASRERVLARLGKTGVEDVGLEDLEILIGLGTAIKDGAQRVDEAFPEPAPAPAAPSEDGKRIRMGASKKPQPAQEPPAHDPDTGEMPPMSDDDRQPGDEG